MLETEQEHNQTPDSSERTSSDVSMSAKRTHDDRSTVSLINERDGILASWSITAAGIARGRSQQPNRFDSQLVLRAYLEHENGTKKVQDLLIERWNSSRRIALPKTIRKVVISIGMRSADGFSHIIRSSPLMRPRTKHGKFEAAFVIHDRQEDRFVRDRTISNSDAVLRASKRALTGESYATWLPPASARVPNAPRPLQGDSVAGVLNLIVKMRLDFESARRLERAADYVVNVVLPTIAMLRRVEERDLDARFSLVVGPRLLLFMASAAGRAAIEERLKGQTELGTLFSTLEGDLPGELRRMHIGNRIEVIGCTFTHCILPDLMGGRGLISLQLKKSLTVYRDVLGFSPRGFMLANQGYETGIGPILAQLEVRYAVLDSDPIFYGDSKPCGGVLAPIHHAGTRLLVTGVDEAFMRWLPSSDPSPHLAYRAKRDAALLIGDDPKWSNATRTSIDRYEFDVAASSVKIHASDWWSTQVSRLGKSAGKTASRLCSTGTIDAERLVEDWFEGLSFVEEIARLSHGSQGIKLGTLSPHIETQSAYQSLVPSGSVPESKEPDLMQVMIPMLARASNQYQRILELHETWGLPTRVLLEAQLTLLSLSEVISVGSETAATFARSCAEYIEHLVQVRELSGRSEVNILDRDILAFWSECFVQDVETKPLPA